MEPMTLTREQYLALARLAGAGDRALGQDPGSALALLHAINPYTGGRGEGMTLSCAAMTAYYAGLDAADEKTRRLVDAALEYARATVGATR